MKRFAFAPVLFALLLVSCAGREGRLLFIDGEGGRQALVVKREGRYLLRRPVLVAEAGRAFYLRYREAAAEASVRVIDADGTALARRSLVAAGVELSLQLPLPRGSRVHGFVLEPPGQAEVREAGVERAFTGFERGARGLRLGGGVRRLSLSERGVEVELDPQAFAEEGEPWRIELEFASFGTVDWAEFRRYESSSAEGDPPPGRRARASVLLSAGDREIRFAHGGLPGPQRLALYPATVGFDPQRLALRPGSGSRLAVGGLTVAAHEKEPGPATAPLPADPGTVLLYDPRYWRQPDYELFVWTRFPDLLILDTRDYAVQDRFFKRLAFYVEKLGYRGRLVGEEEVRDLHGFNAHDYRAEDLARFFREADARGFALNAEEELLRAILIRNGVLRRSSSLEAGRGGILSLSQSSSGPLRRHLITHEAFHGLFFVLPGYREACFDAWQALDDEEREFWRLFLRWGGYDADNAYLAVNEFQGYLFQQNRANLGFYFRELVPARLARGNPERAAWVRRFLATHPASFERSYDRLAPVLRREARLEGGLIVEVEKN